MKSFAGIEWIDEAAGGSSKKPVKSLANLAISEPAEGYGVTSKAVDFRFEPKFGGEISYLKVSKLQQPTSFVCALKERYEESPEEIDPQSGMEADESKSMENQNCQGPTYSGSGKMVEIEKIGYSILLSFWLFLTLKLCGL